jgi:hypothetical protein
MDRVRRISRGKNVAFAALLCAAVVAVLAAVSWQEILTHYYCRQLVKDPRRMIAMVDAAQGTFDRFALPIVLESTAGQSALLDSFLTLLTMRDDGPLPRGNLGRTGVVFLWINKRHVGYCTEYSGFYKPIDSFEHLGWYRDWDRNFNPETFLKVWNHLVNLKGKVLTSTINPELSFEFLSGEEAQSVANSIGISLSSMLSMPPNGGMILVGRRLTSPPPGSSSPRSGLPGPPGSPGAGRA